MWNPSDVSPRPYQEGGNLCEHLDKYGRLQCPQAFQLIEVIGNGLRRLHEQGVVHRDLKSRNIMLEEVLGENSTPELRPIIIDLGLAAMIDADKTTELEQTVATKGTVQCGKFSRASFLLRPGTK